MGSDSILVFGAVLSGVLVFGLLPIVLYFQQERRKREMEHTERMKALELGRTLPGESQEGSWPVSAKVAVWIGAGVPLWVFGCAWLASEMVGYHETIWMAAMMVGLASVISGSILYSRNPEQASSPLANSKPQIEEDAYDVVSARG